MIKQNPWAIYLVVASAFLLASCGVKHQIQRLADPAKTVDLVVDYTTGLLSAHGAVVTLQVRGGNAVPVATFHNVQTINVAWLDPEDIAICEIGDVVDHKTDVNLGGTKDDRNIHVQYKCPMI